MPLGAPCEPTTLPTDNDASGFQLSHIYRRQTLPQTRHKQCYNKQSVKKHKKNFHLDTVLCYNHELHVRVLTANSLFLCAVEPDYYTFLI